MHQNKPLVVGLLGSIGLVLLYFAVLTIAESAGHAIGEFTSIWYWILLLSAGFGIQLSLWMIVRESKRAMAGSTTELVASGGISAGAMIACCAHHLVDLVPLLGLSATALFLTRFQLPFIILGVFSNLIGIIVILAVMQRHGLYPKTPFFKGLFTLNMRPVRTGVISFSALVVASGFVLTAANADANTVIPQVEELTTVINEESGVSFEVTPKEFAFGAPVEFEILINTHVGSLDFDMTDVTRLIIDGGSPIEPLSWSGSPPGAHHRNGRLLFPEVPEGATTMEMQISGVYDIKVRKFTWTLAE